MPTRRTVVLSITCIGLVLLSAAAYRTPRTAREEPVGPDVEARASDDSAPAAPLAELDSDAPMLREGTRPGTSAETVDGSRPLVLRIPAPPSGLPVLCTLPPTEEIEMDDRAIRTQSPGLAVTLRPRAGGAARAPDVAPTDVAGTVALRWSDVPPAIYDIEVRVRGHVGEAQARLAGILVADDGSSADPRLSSWTPYPDIDVMALDVRSGRGADLEDVELALARGTEGEVRGFPGAARARFWLVLAHGAEGIAFARARGHGEWSGPFRSEGHALVDLPNPVMPHVRWHEGESGPVASFMLEFERVAEEGSWLPPLAPMLVSTSAALGQSENSYVLFFLPAPGRYRVLGTDGGVRPVEFDLPAEKRDIHLTLEPRE